MSNIEWRPHFGGQMIDLNCEVPLYYMRKRVCIEFAGVCNITVLNPIFCFLKSSFQKLLYAFFPLLIWSYSGQDNQRYIKLVQHENKWSVNDRAAGQ